MNKEEIESLFKKYKVRIPKEKQGQSECYKCKENHKYSLTWTSFLYEYEEHYYCYEHILNILLQQENQQLEKENKKYKQVIDKLNDAINKMIHTGYLVENDNGAIQFMATSEKSEFGTRAIVLLDILKEVE